MNFSKETHPLLIKYTDWSKDFWGAKYFNVISSVFL